MQYIYDEQEMADHRAMLAKLERLPTVEKLQEFCTFVADNLILTTGWASGRPWGCIIKGDTTRRGAVRVDHYCDECPAKNVCPHPYKRWSK